MNDENFILEYEKLLDKGYCDCNEMNCLDNDTPRKILNIVKGAKLEAKQLLIENKQLKEQLQQKEDIINKIREYLTSYESISEIEGLNNVKENKKLDEKTMNEMIRRYMNVHDKTLEILEKSDN